MSKDRFLPEGYFPAGLELDKVETWPALTLRGGPHREKSSPTSVSTLVLPVLLHSSWQCRPYPELCIYVFICLLLVSCTPSPSSSIHMHTYICVHTSMDTHTHMHAHRCKLFSYHCLLRAFLSCSFRMLR